MKHAITESFLRGLPKAELHLHIEGTLEPELMFAIAKRNKIPLRFQSVGELRQAYDFSNLQSFLDIYYEGAKVLLHEQDFFDLAMAYFERAAAQGVRHAEIFFDPQTHTERGVAFEAVITGLARAQKEAEAAFKITSKLILCFLRHLPADAAMRTLDEALPYKHLLTAVGLDSSEVGHPPKKFKKVFERARDAGLMAVAHAGEEGPPEYVWQALDELGVSRIDHGVRSVEDKKLVARLVRDNIPLTVCPLSNVKLKVFHDLKHHNLRKMLDLGLKATVNSDDPSYFGGYVLENLVETQKALDLTRDELAQLERNAFEAAFLSPAEKKKLVHQLDEFLKSN